MMRNRILILPCCTVLAAGACGKGPAAETAPTQSRSFVHPRWERAWQAGGTEADTTLLQPWRVAVGDDHVFVLDKAGFRVAAFRRSDGQLAWITGSRGSGPREFALPTALAVSRSGDVWVADARNSRITVLAPDGRVRRSHTIPDLPYPESLCPLPDGGMLLATSAQDRPLLRLSAQGTVVERSPLPWADLAAAAPLSVQKLLAPSGDGCVLALTLGRGFAVFSGGEARTHAYVEAFPLPAVKETREKGPTVTRRLVDMRVAAQAVAATSTEISVAPGGRVIDVYGREDGAYRRSLVTPTNVVALAHADGVYYVLTFRQGYPSLVAARPTLPSDSAARPTRP